MRGLVRLRVRLAPHCLDRLLGYPPRGGGIVAQGERCECSAVDAGRKSHGGALEKLVSLSNGFVWASLNLLV